MDISAEKLDIIHKICEIQDADLLDLIRSIIDIPIKTKSDWWDHLPGDEKSSLEQGLSDLKNGNVQSHDQIRKKYEKYLKD